MTDDGLVIADTNKQSYSLSLHCEEDFQTSFDVYRKTEIGLTKGDVISITRNGFDEKNKRLNNGQILEVIAVEKKNTIHLRNATTKKEYSIPLDFGHLNHAYCITSHASQGKTVDEVFIAQPSSTFSATDMKQFYVSVSRARDRVHIYTDDKEAMLDNASSTGDRLGAIELVSPIKKPFAQKMIQRMRQEEILINASPTTPQPEQRLRLHAPKPNF